MLNLLFKLIVKLRKLFEPIAWYLFCPLKWKDKKDLFYWEIEKDLEPRIFSRDINSLRYKSDRIKGLLDFSFPLSKPQYFFKDLDYGRDCDDWARIWCCYYVNRGKYIEEWVVTNKKHPFTDSHFVAVVKEDDGYHLLNYRMYDTPHKTVEEALDDLNIWGSTYISENRLQCLYKRYGN